MSAADRPFRRTTETRAGKAARRALLVATLLAGGAGLALAAADAAPLSPGPKPDAAWTARLRHDDGRKVYRGEELETIGMPCGGVASGQVYVRGDGTLAYWWIFNNTKNTGVGSKCYRTYRPPSPIGQGFCIRVEGEGGAPAYRNLSRDGFDAIEFVGEYPIAEIRYRTKAKDALPVEVDLEVFSPFIPLNAKDSALPVTVLRFTVRNTSAGPVKAQVSGWLQNGVLLHEAGRYGSRVRSRNRAATRDGLTAVVLDAVEKPQAERPEPRREVLFEDFEKGLGEAWTVTGDAGAAAPASGKSERQQPVAGWHGKRFINTFQPNDTPQCTLVSKPFTIAEPFIAFLIGGGGHEGATCMNLVVDGQVVRTAAGRNDERLMPRAWNVREFKGREAHLEIVDKQSGAWGHVNVDFIRFTNFVPGPSVPPPAEHPGWGDMCLAVLDAKAAAGTVTGPENVFAPAESLAYSLGEKRPGAVTAEVPLAAGESRSVTFLVGWYFPQRPRSGRMYANWFDGSLGVAEYVAKHFDRLRRDTHLFRDTYFDTTLPYWLAARLAMPASTLATETCQWWANGRFYAWEGVGCCAGTCTHVWNYEHACARLFPELSRSTRLMQDLEPTAGFDAATGLVGFRSNRRYAADGQCGTVLKVYREHLMSADGTFLAQAWPATKQAMEYLVQHDANGGEPDGLIEDSQHNTFDINFVGPNTFVGSLYLAALRAAEEMARLMGDLPAADRYRRIMESGSKKTMDRLWNGEYFVQIIPPGESDKFQYGTGCLADQMFGQGWKHQVGLGYIVPEEAAQGALRSVYKYNFTGDIGPYNQEFPPERWFARAGEPGLFICTWPKGGRPATPVRYRDEVWTGIEYQAAGHMLWEGLVDEGLALVRAVHERYDGTDHNPWNEVECGDHYARALASWGCLIGLSGYVYDGPAGLIGFAPRMQADDFGAFFTAAEGWGKLVQRRAEGRQTDRIEVAWGRLRVRTLVFEVPAGAGDVAAAVTVAGKPVKATAARSGPRVTLTLADDAVVEAGKGVEAVLTW